MITRVGHRNILNGPPATIVSRLGRNNTYFSIVTEWNRVFHPNLRLLTGALAADSILSGRENLKVKRFRIEAIIEVPCTTE